MLLYQSGKSFISFAKTNMDCWEKKRLEVFMMVAYLNRWQRSTNPRIASVIINLHLLIKFNSSLFVKYVLHAIDFSSNLNRKKIRAIWKLEGSCKWSAAVVPLCVTTMYKYVKLNLVDFHSICNCGIFSELCGSEVTL